MNTLDSIIALRSHNTQSSSSTSLPVEILLRIRSNLQQSLVDALAEETSQALVDYESALVEGLCADCFWWNSDVYGSDVWSWVENDYRGPCSCCVVGYNDPRIPSPTKERVTELYGDAEIVSRAQWIRTYISRTYLRNSRTKSTKSFVRKTLESLGCVYEQKVVIPKAPVDDAGVIEGLKKAQTQNSYATASFGAPIIIRQSASLQQAEDADVTLRRLQRELAVRPILTSCGDEVAQPSRILSESSATRFVDKIYKRSACEKHFLSQRVPAKKCFECLKLAASSKPITSTLLVGALSAVYLVARVVF